MSPITIHIPDHTWVVGLFLFVNVVLESNYNGGCSCFVLTITTS